MIGKSFIEVQFPVSKISKESYKERKAVQSQTLINLGKWWGRKPLVLVRATILGTLLPATDNPKEDMRIFLNLMLMDSDGLIKRRNKKLLVKDIISFLTLREIEKYIDSIENKVQWKESLSENEIEKVTLLAWNRMSYDKKLSYCMRIDEIDNFDNLINWKLVNEHLNISCNRLDDLIGKLSYAKFGKRVKVGDCFCGGGSIPYEAARMSCDVYASDLNPVAGLLSFADIVIGKLTQHEKNELVNFQDRVYQLVNNQILEWGIESRENGDRANAYIYCNETICPECGIKVPLISSLMIGKGLNTIASIKKDGDKCKINIMSGVSENELKEASESGTVKNGKLICPCCKKETPISSIRRDRKNSDGETVYGLRIWDRFEYDNRDDDTFTERLYCIRYKREDGQRYYTEPNERDIENEKKVNFLIDKYFKQWQEEGYIPSGEIEEGYNTSQVIRERGWKYWHQLFNKRQLLTLGLIQKVYDEEANSEIQMTAAILSLHRCCDKDSKLCRWGVGQTRESIAQTFYNQALNTTWEYGVRPLPLLKEAFDMDVSSMNVNYDIDYDVELIDARHVEKISDIWITDPPYADAVNYHELTEYFISWDKKSLHKLKQNWYADSKRILAVKGKDEEFSKSMVSIYKKLTEKMPNNGTQVIMFTHQDVNVWANLALIVWSAGLQVTSAWNIVTETDAVGIKSGNYVKGTVLLILKKRLSEEVVYLDELYPDIEDEVKNQIQSMHNIDDKEDPNFTDSDYILAAYAAALKVLTSIKKIEDIDVEYELSKEVQNDELSPVARLIESAKKIAYDQLIPDEFDSLIWRQLSTVERFYIKGLEIEKNGIYQVAAYQELARGYGASEYKDLMQSTKANSARLKAPKEWSNKNISGEGFETSLLRNVLMAIYLGGKEEDSIINGKNWLRNEVVDYWNKREIIKELFKFIITFSNISNMEHWHDASKIAEILKELVANDSI